MFGFVEQTLLDSEQCHALVDTGSTISLIRFGLLTGVDIMCFGATEHDTLRITTVTGKQVIMRGKRTVQLQS